MFSSAATSPISLKCRLIHGCSRDKKRSRLPLVHLIDPISLSFFIGVTVLALFLCMAVIFPVPHPYPGFREWVFSAFLLGATGALIGLRGLIPDFISVVVSNVLGLLGFLAIRQGLGRFFGIPLNRWFAPLLLGFLTATQSIFLYAHDSLLLRTIFISATNGLAFAACARLTKDGSRRLFPQSPVFPLAFVSDAFAIFHALRILLAGFMLASPVQNGDRILFGASILIMIPGTLMLYLGFLTLHARRTSAELIQSQAEIRVLSGLLPICCQCKKIRTENQEWQPVEVYIRDHSEAQFSHGICPDCARALYPDD